MRTPRTAIAIAALLASLALPSLALAAPYIPPGNPAASQYTETFPSSGGNVEVNSSIGDHGRSPQKALGHHTAKALEEAGPEGAALAGIAAETAAPGGSAEGAGGEGSGPGGKGSKSGGDGHHGSKSGGAAGTGGSGNGGGSGGGGAGSSGGGTGTPAGAGATAGSQPGGGSAVGQVVSHATLSSSGATGVFLPLALVAALVWAVAYAVRRRRQVAARGA
jgi:hypothetical protein